jgi:hypothetical protein
MKKRTSRVPAPLSDTAAASQLQLAARRRDFAKMANVLNQVTSLPVENLQVLEAFITSAMSEDLSLVRAFVDRGIDINTQVKGHRVLTLAAASPSPEFFDGLLDLGADPSLPGLDGMTPLQMAASVACKVSDPQICLNRVKLLAARGVDLDASNDVERTALDDAFRSGSVIVVKLLLKLGAQLSACFGGGVDCWSHAVMAPGEELMKLALKAGADPDWPFTFDQPAMGYVAEQGWVSKVNLLIRAGAPRKLPDGRDARKVAREKKVVVSSIWDMLADHEVFVKRLDSIAQTIPGLRRDYLFGGEQGYFWNRLGCFCPWNTSLVVRIGAKEAKRLIGEPGIDEFVQQRKAQKEWVMLSPELLKSDDDLKGWIERAVSYVQS